MAESVSDPTAVDRSLAKPKWSPLLCPVIQDLAFLLPLYDNLILKGEAALSKGSSKRVKMLLERSIRGGQNRAKTDGYSIIGMPGEKGSRRLSGMQHPVKKPQSRFTAQSRASLMWNTISSPNQPPMLSEYAIQYLERYAKINKRSWKTDRSYIKSMEEHFGNVYLGRDFIFSN